MSDGLWNSGQSLETIRQQDLSRHRLLVVSVGQDLTTQWPPSAASGLASLDPNTIAAGTVNAADNRGFEGGPHFIMSPVTPDGAHTFGFEMCLFTTYVASPALPGAGGYDVTPWVLLSNTMNPTSYTTPIWAAMETTSINPNELWHTFDVNACPIRFQIENLAVDPTTANLDVAIAFSEI